jgi:hypothetical protein
LGEGANEARARLRRTVLWVSLIYVLSLIVAFGLRG